MSNVKVSIIILNAFSTYDLESCLNSLNMIEYANYEIIVVDYKTPKISALIKNNYPKVRLITLVGNDIGPSAMHNVGIASSDSQSRYVAFLDNDTVVEKKWLSELVNVMESDERIAAVQSKILLYDNPHFLNTCGNKSNFLAVGWPDGYATPDHFDCSVKEISFPSGAATLFRKKIINKIGRFDESYFIYADDLDVGLRTLLAGYKILYCPTSIVYHKYRFLRSKRGFYFLNRNRLRTFLKLYDARTYLLMIPPFCLYEFYVFSYAILNRLTREIINCYWNNLIDLKTILIGRRNAQQIKSISDRALIKKLEGKINFIEISNIPAVVALLNPFLQKYRKLLINNL